MKHIIFRALLVSASVVSLVGVPVRAQAAYQFSDYSARLPIHTFGSMTEIPFGLIPVQVKNIYNLPSTGGNGTIAIIGAYNPPTIEKDLGIFSKQFGLPECTTKNGCFEKHLMETGTKADSGWAAEASLDVEWAHAIAPKAKILLVLAKTQSGANLLKAVDYARGRKDVVAISMSWGGAEFTNETLYDSHFKSQYGAIFFAASGDDGAGTSWPAVSPNVIAVGGTTLQFAGNGVFLAETAWSGSGGGVSEFENAPLYQRDYTIARAGTKRAIPDVSYAADPKSGFSVYISPSDSKNKKGWRVMGGTSAGAPQWAAIQALSRSVSLEKLYAAKASERGSEFLRDIVSGRNGDCKYFCNARKRYDYLTGLGSPLTTKF